MKKQQALTVLCLVAFFSCVPDAPTALPLPARSSPAAVRSASPPEQTSVTSEVTTAPPLPLQPTANSTSEKPRVYVLTYHSISDRGSSFTITTKAAFRRQLELLKRDQRKLVSLQELIRFVRGEISLEDKSTLITFDDGYESSSDAARMVERYGGRAALFVPTNYVNHGGITWAALKSLKARGHEVHSHTLSHPALPTLLPLAASRELVESDAIIREHLGETSERRVLAYPFGFYDQELTNLLRQGSTYEAALTIRPGPIQANDDLMQLHRDMIRRDLSDNDFLEIINAKSLGDLQVTWNAPLEIHAQSALLPFPNGLCKAIVDDSPCACVITAKDYRIQLKTLPRRAYASLELEVIDEARQVYRGGEVTPVFGRNHRASTAPASSGQ